LYYRGFCLSGSCPAALKIKPIWNCYYQKNNPLQAQRLIFPSLAVIRILVSLNQFQQNIKSEKVVKALHERLDYIRPLDGDLKPVLARLTQRTKISSHNPTISS
jgi:hypothetical protein